MKGDFATKITLAAVLIAQPLTPIAANAAYNCSTAVYRTGTAHYRSVAVAPVGYRYYARPYGHYYYHRSVFNSHPIVSRAAVGAGLGAIGGALVGAISGRHRAGRGALIGAGTGALFGTGLGLYRNRQHTGYWF